MAEAQVRHLPSLGWDVTDDPSKADIIACHVTVPGAEGFLADGKPHGWVERYADKPIVVHNHGLYWAEYEWGRVEERINAEAMESMRIADAITGPSEWVSRCLRRHLCRPVETIHHGVDLDEWSPPEHPTGPYVLWDKSRVDPVCDPAPVLAVARRMPDVRFVLTVPAMPGAPPNVEFTGPIPFDHARNLSHGAAIYLATTRETFGISILQALASGVPVAGWAWGGQAEMGLPDEWLCTPGDIDGLAMRVRALLDANRDGLRLQARAVAERFPWPQQVARYADVYSRVLSARTRAHAAPRTSIVVTAYNLAQHLPGAIDSVLAQTDRDWELVVVDDASPDQSGRIADDYAAIDERVRVIHNAENQYLAGARNTGIEAARGRYILPLDADDRLTPNAVEILAGELDRDRHTHVAYGGVRFVGPDGQPISYPGHIHIDDRDRRCQKAGCSGWPVRYSHALQMGRETEDFGRPVRGRGQIPPYASMFRREAWANTGGYRTRWRSSEDCDLWCRLGEYGYRPRMVTDADVLTYMVRGDSMSHTEGWRDRELKRWFPSSRDARRSPAGAATGQILPVPSLDPPAISVVIPVGPLHGSEVINAIDSVAAQTSDRWECIVVNDTGAELPRLPSWVQVVEPSPSAGWMLIAGQMAYTPIAIPREHFVPGAAPRFGSPATARNAGLAFARGRYVLPLDADDWLEPGAIEAFVAASNVAQNHVIYPDMWHNPRRGPDYNDDQFEVFHLDDWDPAILRRKGVYGTGVLIPRKALLEVGGWRDMPWEDWDLSIRLAMAGVCHRRLAYPAFTYRMQAGSIRETHVTDIPTNLKLMREANAAFWEGDLPMGCGCGSKTIVPMGAALAQPNGQAPAAASSGMTKIVYIGTASRFPVRGGKSGQQYRFSPNQPLYVWKADADELLRRRDFRAMDVEAPVSGDAPSLLAIG